MGHPRGRGERCWESFSWQLVRSLPDRTGHPRSCGHTIPRGDWYARNDNYGVLVCLACWQATLPAYYRDSVLRRDQRRLDALGYPARRPSRPEHPDARAHHAKPPAGNPSDCPNGQSTGTQPASVWIWLLEGGEDGAEVQALGASYTAAATYDAWLVRCWKD